MANTNNELDGLAHKAKSALEDYLDTLGDNKAENVYRLVLDEVERPMLEVMMRYTHGNQRKAADAMGINRATLRTKLKHHGML